MTSGVRASLSYPPDPGDPASIIEETIMTTTELSGITAFLDRLADTWKTNDGTALSELFTADGSLINPFGERADGRNGVAAMYGEYFRGMLAGTTTSCTLERTRAVDGDHALLDAEQIITAPTGETALTVHLSALLRRDGDGWRFVDCRPYVVADRP
ncbi:SgcJ/EcaC family oxidoreductase [Nocardia sp. NPDC059240]|uniref:SgcJ/EcaC family oxidoreductase n=1 Tax=Nocardia sp. NPDC059240 TaxID=3346786 RepID=UPI00367AFD22